MKQRGNYQHPNNGQTYPIMVGRLSGKTLVAGGSLKAMRNEEEVISIFLHAGQRGKDGWRQEPGGWVVEYPSSYQSTDQIDGAGPPWQILNKLAGSPI